MVIERSVDHINVGESWGKANQHSIILPWCKPAFAKTMLQALDQRTPGSVHRYVEIDHCGHCPNHEAPQAVAHLINRWVSSQTRRTNELQLVDPSKMVFEEAWARTTMTEKRADEISLSLVDKLAVTFV